MNPRLGIALALLLLFGGAAYLWLNPQPPAPAPNPALPDSTTPDRGGRPHATHFIFAMSWQPGFCETEPRKPECRSQQQGRFDAEHFTLHGLWPDDEYCDVPAALIETDKAGRWRDLPALQLTSATSATLDEMMPGTRSMLERHEWIKHGTCSGASEDAYFAAAINVLRQLNASLVRTLFSASIGAPLTLGEIRDSFDQAFGSGAGDRIRLACAEDGNRRLITEITIGLRGDLLADQTLKPLLRAASPTSGGCGQGIVDRIGDQ